MSRRSKDVCGNAAHYLGRSTRTHSSCASTANNEGGEDASTLKTLIASWINEYRLRQERGVSIVCLNYGGIACTLYCSVMLVSLSYYGAVLSIFGGRPRDVIQTAMNFKRRHPLVIVIPALGNDPGYYMLVPQVNLDELVKFIVQCTPCTLINATYR